MAKVQYRKLSKEERELLQAELFETLRRLGVKKKGLGFLGDLLTGSEVVMLARRIQIAKRLLAGEEFEKIASGLRVGMATIQSVDRWLEAKFDAYRRELPPRIRKHKTKKLSWWEIDPASFRATRARYPLTFPILNILLGDPRRVEIEQDECPRQLLPE